MNIIDIQDNLKNFSENQLINEMQRPSGNAPQFLVLSEITRRKRMRDDFNMRKAANEPTVAQEAVASAGVPAQGIMGMSEAMAPKAAMAQGGIGSVMSQPMKSQMPQPTSMPQDGIMAMASGGSTGQRIREVRMKNGKIGLFQGNTFLGTKKDRDGDGESLASQIGFGQKGSIVESIKDALGFAEGGVIKAQNGVPLGLRQKNPGNIRPGAGFIGETGADGGYATFGSDDEGLRAIQRLLMTYGDKYGVNTLRGFANRYAPPSDNNPTGNYIDFLADKTGIDPDAEINLAKQGSAIIPAVIGFEQGQQPYSQAQIDRAIRAAGTEDPTEVSAILAESLDDDQPNMLSKALSAINPIGEATASAFTPTGNTQVMLDNESDQDDSQKELRSGRRSRRAGTDVLTEADRDVMTVADSFGGIQDILDKKAPRLSDVSGPITNPTQRRTDSTTRRMLEDFGDEFGNIPDLDPKPTVIKDAEEIDLTSPKLLSEAEKRRLSRTGRLAGVNVENRTDSSTETSDETDDKKAEDKAGGADSNKITYNNQAAGTVSSLESEILALQDRMKKSAEQDKWLSLAQAGLSLMSSTNPTLLGALGEAGISGLSAMKEAESRYQEGVVDLINARAKLAKNKTGIDAGNAITRINAIDRALSGADGMMMGEAEKQRLLEEKLMLQREYLNYPDKTTGANIPPATS